MSVLSLPKSKPLTLAVIVFVLVGGAFFLVLPLLVGDGAPQAHGYPLASGDYIASWSWNGVYKDGGQKEAGVRTEIARLKGMLGKQAASGGVGDYDLYVGIASQYELLGDGRNSYQYLSSAIALDGSRGLAYVNMGHLMEELGAPSTARGAYEAALTAEPSSPVYQAALQDFLTRHPQ